MRLSSLAFAFCLASTPAWAQQDPVVGNWRGSLTGPGGTDSPIVITIAKSGERYSGSTNGLAEGADVALRRIEPSAAGVAIEAASESRLGTVVLAARLTPDGNTLTGEGSVGVGSQTFPVTLRLQRRVRADVVQHQVEQTAGYFVGRWKLEYVGGEFPPLSPGNRQGTITFTRTGSSPFVTGVLQGDSFGARFEHRMAIGVDAETDMVVLTETRQDGTEIVSLGNWRSPLAVVFMTAPVQASGRTYQLKRVFSILSESAFDVTEEFSVDGGAFRRLGSGHFTKQ